MPRCRITMGVVTHELFIHYASWCPKIPLKMFVKTFSWCLDAGKLKTEQKLIVTPRLHAVFAIFVLEENGTQSHSAKFLNWGDHVNSVPDLVASPPLLRICRNAFILVLVNESCCLCKCLTELYYFYWLLVVSLAILMAVPFVFSRSWTSLAGGNSKCRVYQTLFKITHCYKTLQ